jgi:DNA-binding transcriptional ArsR family regulator
METEIATLCLAALAQATRLDAFRLLVQAEPAGLAAGELARRLAVPQNTLSAHLNILSHARLAKSQRKGRLVIYRADLTRLRELTLFLLKDCCGGRSEICAPLIAELTCCSANEGDSVE